MGQTMATTGRRVERRCPNTPAAIDLLFRGEFSIGTKAFERVDPTVLAGAAIDSNRHYP